MNKQLVTTTQPPNIIKILQNQPNNALRQLNTSNGTYTATIRSPRLPFVGTRYTEHEGQEIAVLIMSNGLLMAKVVPPCTADRNSTLTGGY